MKEYLSEKNIVYTDHNVIEDRDAAREMVEKSNQMGVPVIIIDNADIVVGFNRAKLDELLA